MFKILGKHVAPPALMPSPMQWGDEAIVRERLGPGSSALTVTRRLYPMRYPFAPAEVVEFYFSFYGPALRALATLDAAGQAALRQELTQLWSSNNKASDGSTFVAAEYLDVLAVRA
jgi:hypothetical protein